MLRRSKAAAFLIALACLCLTAGSAHAQTKTASAEDVAFAFFKTAGQRPDFEKWAQAAEDYKITAPALASQFLEEEKQRLLRRWEAEEEAMEVKLTLPVTLFAGTQDDTSEYWVSFDIPRADPFYLPYHYRGYDIAVMPDGLQKLATHKIEKPQYDLLVSALNGRTSGKADLYVLLVPVKSYIDAPVELNGAMQWVMIAKPAAAIMRARNGTSLWSYAQDWYITPENKAVRGLYNKESIPETTP